MKYYVLLEINGWKKYEEYDYDQIEIFIKKGFLKIELLPPLNYTLNPFGTKVCDEKVKIVTLKYVGYTKRNIPKFVYSKN